MVSVVMSVLNCARFLSEAVESILEQSFREFEFIVIDDGSTDGSGSILDSYGRRDPRVRVYHQQNRGMADSWNRGCGLAQGKYIARMDGDDIALPKRLMWQVEFMEKHPEVAVLGGAVDVINARGELLVTYPNPIGDREIKSALLRRCALWHPTVLMRKEVLVSVAGYRKAAVDAEDYDLWLRIADHFQLANLEAVVLKYRVHPWQLSVRKCRQQALSMLAARAAASSRRDGNPDPLESVGETTPAVLASLGVTESAQQVILARECLRWITILCRASEYSAALNMVTDVFRSSDWKGAERRVISELRILAARLYWHDRRFVRSALNAGHAVMKRPIILGRPLKPFLRWWNTVA